MNTVDISSETLFIQMTEGEMVAERHNLERVTVDANQIARCDLCNVSLGRFGDLNPQAAVSPEKMRRAIMRGLIPDIPDFSPYLLRQWKRIYSETESEWALCGKCLQQVNDVLKR
jgi:hypothetical protein